MPKRGYDNEASVQAALNPVPPAGEIWQGQGRMHNGGLLARAGLHAQWRTAARGTSHAHWGSGHPLLPAPPDVLAAQPVHHLLHMSPPLYGAKQ
eukprot:gene14658-12401_t